VLDYFCMFTLLSSHEIVFIVLNNGYLGNFLSLYCDKHPHSDRCYRKSSLFTRNVRKLVYKRSNIPWPTPVPNPFAGFRSVFSICYRSGSVLIFRLFNHLINCPVELIVRNSFLLLFITRWWLKSLKCVQVTVTEDMYIVVLRTSLAFFYLTEFH